MITKQELKNLKYLASEGMVDHEKYKLLFTNDATDTVLRLIEALEIATNYLQAASSEDFCLCGDTRGRAKTGSRKIYGPT